MKLGQLLNSVEALQRLGQMKMPAKAAYGVARNLRMIDVELELFNEARKQLVERYQCINEETNAIEIKDQAGLDREYRELVETEIDYQPHTIRLELLDSVELTPSDLAILFWLIEAGDQKERQV